ncbi:hypothetical protein GH975_00470 [Litorivicinus lipolyticus]|uniref:NRDE family protein n=1 Tax=Litorivicinus lipolyticus TaxID=418701 RepID=A0A5Q2Q590_9GAMM|nr:NRDE family protein [Litorivicinus lipolyticus]QGG79109.1 hypothetical protein GH975_00470 [Litorivicinus lipolyticus]
MCLIAVAWQHHPGRALELVANRDEFTARATAAAHHWDNGLFGGRDLAAGGTWLAIAPGGRMACLTNVRDPNAAPGAHSRGELVTNFLTSSESAPDYLGGLDTHRYSPFNLLLLDTDSLWFFNSQAADPRKLGPGVYGLSNATLDSPWPKTQAVTAAMRQSPAHAHRAMLDTRTYPDAQLPNTGINPAWETRLSSARIVGDDYATLSTTQVRSEGAQLRLTETTHATANAVSAAL